MILRRSLWPMLIAGLLFVLTVVAMGPITQWAVTRFEISPGIIEQVAG